MKQIHLLNHLMCSITQIMYLVPIKFKQIILVQHYMIKILNHGINNCRQYKIKITLIWIAKLLYFGLNAHYFNLRSSVHQHLKCFIHEI